MYIPGRGTYNPETREEYAERTRDYMREMFDPSIYQSSNPGKDQETPKPEAEAEVVDVKQSLHSDAEHESKITEKEKEKWEFPSPGVEEPDDGKRDTFEYPTSVPSPTKDHESPEPKPQPNPNLEAVDSHSAPAPNTAPTPETEEEPIQDRVARIKLRVAELLGHTATPVQVPQAKIEPEEETQDEEQDEEEETEDSNLICSWAPQLAKLLRENEKGEKHTETSGQTRKPENELKTANIGPSNTYQQIDELGEEQPEAVRRGLPENAREVDGVNKKEFETPEHPQPPKRAEEEQPQYMLSKYLLDASSSSPSSSSEEDYEEEDEKEEDEEEQDNDGGALIDTADIPPKEPERPVLLPLCFEGIKNLEIQIRYDD